MSMLRCLYRRVKSVKCSFGESGSSITFNVSTNQDIVKLHVRLLNGMTSDRKIVRITSLDRLDIGRAMQSIETEKTENSDLSLVRNGLNLESVLRNTSSSVSEGYYSNTWGKGSRRNSQSNGEQTENQKKTCDFDLGPIKVHLIGLIGTAVAVGIDVHNRINEWMPYQNRRHHPSDVCNYHSSYFKRITNGPPSQSSLSGVLDISKPTGHSWAACPENGSSFTTIQYLHSCKYCRYFFDKVLFRIYEPTSSSTICNLFHGKSAFPKIAYNQSDSSDFSQEDESDQDYVDGVDGPSISNQLNHLQFDASSSSFTSTSESESSSTELNFSSSEDVSRVRQRKKSIFMIKDEEKQELQLLAEKNSQSSKSDYISLSESSESSSDCVHLPIQGSLSPSSVKKVEEDKIDDDIAAIFRMASIEYADQLNNLLAISLMSGHKPDEAMHCWSNCEASSRAFFNMGVAYESGLYSKNTQPDLDRAHDCYALAASMGHRDAIYNLAIYYLYGKGRIEANVERGLQLLEFAATKGVEAAQTFCAELHRSQMLDEVRQNLQRKDSSVESVKSRTPRFSMRPSASMFGRTATRLQPKHSTSKSAVEGGVFRRNNSAPNLMDLNTSPIVIASK